MKTPNLAADDYHHVLTLHNRLIYKNKINTREVLLKNINAAFLKQIQLERLCLYRYIIILMDYLSLSITQEARKIHLYIIQIL